jgi:hypothetical protein
MQRVHLPNESTASPRARKGHEPRMTEKLRTRRILRGAAPLLVAGGLLVSACQPKTEIDVAFGPAREAATRVAQCESGLDPNAVSPGGGNHGLFQINNVHKADFERVTGQPWSKIYDAHLNTKYAKWLYDRQGWAPWTCRTAV